MNLAALQARAQKARDHIAREKHELACRAWQWQQAQAMDRLTRNVRVATEQLESRTAAAADQGKSEVTLLRLSFQSCDIRKVVQEELHRSQTREPDPYPALRALGPPSFKEIEKWLKDELKLKDVEGQCPLDWLLELATWVERREKSGRLGRLLSRRPKVPEVVETLLQECERRKLRPRFERYHQFEDEGVAIVVDWS